LDRSFSSPKVNQMMTAFVQSILQKVSYTICAASFLGAFYVCLVGAKCSIALMAGQSRHFLRGNAYICTMRLLGVLLLIFAAMFFRNALYYLSVDGLVS